MEDELRDLLRRKADRIPPRAGVPRRMLRRARGRVVLTATAGVVALATIAFGGYTGVQALTDPKALQPIGRGPAPTSSSPRPQRCMEDNLSPLTDLSGAAGHQQGSLIFMNNSDKPCTLQGRPLITFLDAKGKQLSVLIVRTQAWWQVEVKPKPAGWPVVTLQPGEAARVRTSWGNWCGSELPYVWTVRIPIVIPDPHLLLHLAAPEPPTCAGPSLPSTLEVGPFEPAS